MAARRQKQHTLKKQKKASPNDPASVGKDGGAAERKAKEEVIEEHLPPLALTLVVLLCSGALLVFAMRDLLATGKNIGGSWDEAMLLFTKSTDWFEDEKGWKSTQGGFSAIQQVTTDENNMGGFFIRKLAGGAAVAVHLQKMVPLLVHPTGAQWIMGHFRPLLWTAAFGNIAIAAFYGFYLKDLFALGVREFPLAILSVLAFETLVILYYLLVSRQTKREPAVAMPEGKTPASPVSNIAARTILIVTTAMSVVAARDLFFPGQIIDFIPRDDIYLEWTNAFFHSPPEGSPEAEEQGLEAPLFIGDKFVSQFMALHILILSLYKYVCAVLIRYGSDGSGEIKAKMIWKGQAIGDALVLICIRFFTHAASSASLNLRWHLIAIAYETFILGIYGFF